MKRQRAFTLVELLVVISIIAILAGFAMPAFTKAMESADRTKVLNDGKQIALSMKNYAGDFGGEFPFYTDPIRKQGEPQSANDILATLIPDYIPNEQVANYMQAADVLVLPYRSGSVSGVATLAAQVGLPVLASTSGAIAQQANTVAIIPADDSAAWARALDAFLAQPEPSRIPHAIDPSWQFFHQQLSEVWHEIAS